MNITEKQYGHSNICKPSADLRLAIDAVERFFELDNYQASLEKELKSCKNQEPWRRNIKERYF